MQIQRLFQIVYTLIRQGPQTAAQLAARLEVSPRTVYRDIDALSGAGIPVYAAKGKGGGIALMEDFVINPSLLDELAAVFKRELGDWLDVDFSDWGGRDAFSLLKNAILDKRVIRFSYFNTEGEKSEREAEPLQLRFKHRSWYLYAFCLHKQDYRLFKLSRIKNMTVMEQGFRPREGLSTVLPPAVPPAPLVNLRLKVDACLAFRVYDEFAEWQIEELAEGGFMVETMCLDNEWAYGYILSFGSHAEVLEPAALRQRVREQFEAALKKYL